MSRHIDLAMTKRWVTDLFSCSKKKTYKSKKKTYKSKKKTYNSKEETNKTKQKACEQTDGSCNDEEVGRRDIKKKIIYKRDV